jgi:predicted DNA-binding antitoxin AbrB/MazE fold protein
MTQTIDAVYENGVFRPLGAVPDVGEGARVQLSIRKPLDTEALDKLAGTLPPNEADEMMRAIAEGRNAGRSR